MLYFTAEHGSALRPLLYYDSHTSQHAEGFGHVAQLIPIQLQVIILTLLLRTHRELRTLYTAHLIWVVCILRHSTQITLLEGYHPCAATLERFPIDGHRGPVYSILLSTAQLSQFSNPTTPSTKFITIFPNYSPGGSNKFAFKKNNYYIRQNFNN